MWLGNEQNKRMIGNEITAVPRSAKTEASKWHPGVKK